MKNSKIYEKDLGERGQMKGKKYKYEMRCAIIGPKEIIGLKDVRCLT